MKPSVPVIGDRIDHAALDDAADVARQQLSREVNPRAISMRAWEGKGDLFLRHLAERPLVGIPLGEASP